MSTDEAGCLTLMYIGAGLAIIGGGLVLRMSGRADAHEEFTECRTLYATADSATVHRTMPQCHKWTLPPRAAAKGEG